MKKRYVALVHGWPTKDRGTINTEISRDAVRRVRMTTRGSGGRAAITHYEVRDRIASPFGKFALVDVRIETGRTHQIRVHMSSIGHPVVGDSLYRAPKELRRPTALQKASTKATSRRTTQAEAATTPNVLALGRNFLHAAAIEFTHPRTARPLSFSAPLPAELTQFLEQIRG